MSVYEMSAESWLGEAETDEDFKKRLRKLRNRRLAAIMRIFGLITQPLPGHALPPPPVVVVEPDRQKRGGQGGKGGSPETEFAARPEGAVMERLGSLAAATTREADAEAYVGALPMLAATLVPAAAPAIIGAAPVLIGGMSSAARILRESQATRDLVRSLPNVAHRTAQRIGRRANSGRPITPNRCARILADTAVEVLSEAALETGATSTLPEVVFDYNTHPLLADNVWQAQAAGHPRELTYIGDQAVARLNRQAAVAGIPRVLSRDEYPFASTVEGGGSAWIGHIPAWQNSAQGGILGGFYRRTNPTGCPFKFRVCVVNHPSGPVPPR